MKTNNYFPENKLPSTEIILWRAFFSKTASLIPFDCGIEAWTNNFQVISTVLGTLASWMVKADKLRTRVSSTFQMMLRYIVSNTL